MWERSLVGLAVVIGWVVVALATTAGLLLVGVLGVVEVGLTSTVGTDRAFGMAFGSACFSMAVITVGTAVRVLAPSAPVRADSEAVDRARAPQLWNMVDELAACCHRRPPFEIRLIQEANASVSERTYLLGLFGGRRYLYVGVPLLVALEPEELRAVLCHELAHEAVGHARLGALTIRVLRAVETSMQQWEMWVRGMDESRLKVVHAVATWPMKVYFTVLWETMGPARREHELAADAIAAGIVGPDVMLRALRGHFAVNRAWHEFDTRLLAAGRSVRVLPDNAFAAFAAYLALPSSRRGLASLRERAPSRLRRTGGTHPSPAEREERLRSLAAAPVDSGPVRGLGDEAGRVSGWFADRRRPPVRVGGPQFVPAQQWLAQCGEFTTARPVSVLLLAVARLVKNGPRTVTSLEWILRQCAAKSGPLPGEFRLLTHGRVPLRELERAEQETEPDTSDEQQLGDAVVALIERTLAGGGPGRWRIRWGGASSLEFPGIAREELVSLVRDAVDRGDAGDLLDRLTRLGLDIAAEPQPVRALTAAHHHTPPQPPTPFEVGLAQAVWVVATVLLTITAIVLPLVPGSE